MNSLNSYRYITPSPVTKLRYINIPHENKNDYNFLNLLITIFKVKLTYNNIYVKLFNFSTLIRATIVHITPMLNCYAITFYLDV